MSITDKQLAVGRVRGIRRFRVDADGSLCGQAVRSYKWSVGENVAVCKRYPSGLPSVAGRARPSPLPHYTTGGIGLWQSITTGKVVSYTIQDYPADMKPDCACGFYSYKDQPTFGLGGVVGIIDGWGKTIVGDNGYRTEKAKIVALVLPTNSRNQIIKRDNVQLTTGYLFAFIATMALLSGKWIDGAALMLVSAMWLASWWYSIRYISTTVAHPSESLYESIVTPSEAAKVRRQYPDVPVYNTIEEAKQAHPLGEFTT